MDAPAAIALVRSTSLSTLVEGEVLRMILTGELDAGQQIKEIAIAERLGVGRSSVREALRALEAAGLVRIEKNRGAFVRIVSEGEAREMYVIREQLEGLAGTLLAPRITAADLAELRGTVDELDRCVAPEHFDRYFPLNLRFHHRIFEMAGNGRLTEMYRRLTNELHTVRRNGLLRGGGLAVSNIEHRRIVDALAARDPAAASAALRAHVAAGGARRQVRADPVSGSEVA
jgi:DNA-binding GntR family transcriptional regulator